MIHLRHHRTNRQMNHLRSHRMNHQTNRRMIHLKIHLRSRQTSRRQEYSFRRAYSRHHRPAAARR
jgi:hypothetical protein